MGELKAFVNDFLGEESASLLAVCPYQKDMDHVLKCQMGCLLRISMRSIEEVARYAQIQVVLEKLQRLDKIVVYLDCLRNISPALLPSCDLILSPSTAEEALQMCLKLIELQAASVVVLDSWFQLPLRAEETAPLFQNNGVARYQFFEKAMTRLSQNSQKNLINVLLIE